jgi:hypothetical protein
MENSGEGIDAGAASNDGGMDPWVFGEVLSEWYRDPLNLGIVALLIGANRLIRVEDREPQALAALVLAWQITALQVVRCVFGPLVSITDAGGREIVVWAISGSAVQLVGAGLLSLPVALMVARGRMRSTLREYRWMVTSCLLSLISAALLAGGAAVVIPSLIPNGYWGRPAP